MPQDAELLSRLYAYRDAATPGNSSNALYAHKASTSDTIPSSTQDHPDVSACSSNEISREVVSALGISIDSPLNSSSLTITARGSQIANANLLGLTSEENPGRSNGADGGEIIQIFLLCCCPLLIFVSCSVRWCYLRTGSKLHVRTSQSTRELSDCIISASWRYRSTLLLDSCSFHHDKLEMNLAKLIMNLVSLQCIH